MTKPPVVAPRSAEARTFVVISVPASLAAWQLGFDLGAFESIDHRWVWNIWVLSVVALVSSFAFRGSGYHLARRWQVVLVLPSLSLAADYFLDSESSWIALVLALLSAATFPLALYLLARQLAGDFFTMRRRIQVVAATLVIGVFWVALLVGEAHPKFLTCDDFRTAGDFVPANCSP